MIEQLLTSPSNQYLFIIGAYRDNEVTELHPIRSLIQNIEKNIENKCEIIHTQLQPLNVEQLCALVKDTFHIQTPTSDADPQKLAELLLLKTYGNPFFVVAFLTNLKDEGLVWFNYDTGNWSWNINNIERLAITENVVDIMATRIRKLSQTTQTILSIAASVGNPFEFGILAQVYNVLNNGEDGEQLMLECARSLWPAIQDGLVVQLGQRALVDKWLSANELENDLPASNSKNEFCFLHDKVQQAAYELMNSDTRKRIHFIIGKILLDIDTQAGTDDHVFDIVSNFRTARGLIVDSQMKLIVAKQSLIAGLRAKLSSAFAPAAEYTTFGVQLLKEIGEDVVWEQHYTLTFELYKLLLQTLGFIGKVDECEILYTFLLTKAATVLDKSAVINIYSRQLEVLQRYEESIKANLQCLELLGESIPFAHNGDIPDILEREIAQLKITMGGRDISTLTDVPPMTDPKYLTIMSILNTSWVSTYFLGLDDLATVLSARMINLSLTHGYNDFTSYAYTSLCYYWKRYASDVSFVRDIGKLGITIADKQGNIVARTKSYLMYGGQAWVAPLRECLRYVEQALELAMECGDYAVAAYAATTIICHHAYLESDLAVVFQNHQKYLSFLKRSNHFIYQRTIHLAQPYRWLWTPPASSALISGLVEHHNDIDEELFLKEFANDNYLLSSYYCGRCCLAYLRYERNVWIHYADKAWEKAHYQKGTHEYIEIIFYIALVYLAHHYTSDEQKQECMSKVDQVIEELQLLAKSQPANGSHKLALIEAERAHKQGRTLDALQSYERAIEAAKEYGIIVVEALAQERLGKMWETQEHCERYTKIHLQEAYYLYHNWGAVAKEEQLRKSYGKILSDIEGDTRPSIFSNLSLLNQSSNASTLLLPNSSPTLPEVNTSKSIDLLTVMQASQVISSEVSLDEFLYNMMKIIIQNAGATMGIFIQASRGNGEQSDTPSDDAKLNLTVIAERNADEEQRDTIRAIPLENYSFPLVSPLVHHVVREKETIVIQDCAKSETYFKYCSEQEMSLAFNRGVRSILCTPIIKHNELKGVLYMENDADAEFTFTDQRIKVIGLLTAQMVISLENARFSLLLESEKRYRTLAVELGIVKKRLEEFINVLCHELRNPLNAIFGNKEIISDLLQDMNARIGHQGDTASPTLSEQEVQTVIHECLAEIRDAVKAMTISSDHLKDIVDTVLTVSMLESHTVKLQSIPFSPLDMIKMVNIMFKAKIEEKKLQLKFESNTNDSIFVLGDPYRFKEIMINLLSNAIKFTEDGVITVRYEELGRTDTHVSLQIAVEDTGIGLTEPEIAKLFQPFSQANSQTYSKYGGSGLGLKISKEIVEHMGGQIKVSSQISSGSRFYFTLNLKIVNAPNSVPQVKKNNVVQKDELSNANYKILIVEDNIINQKLLARLIKFAGYAYELAANGKEAVDWVLKDNFDVCLMDVEMPIMNGIEATKRIRQLEQEGSLKRTHIPIIGVSANAREEFLQKALACGMDWYITKPYLKSDIYKAVDEWKNKAR
jgi:predicted ATPase/signal transduction histidine kinase/CheY-like chemotaxis protein